MSTLGEGGVLAGLANIQPNLLVCMIPSSTSLPLLISADTLFNSLANVTFFSSFGSIKAVWAAFSIKLVLEVVWFDLVSSSGFNSLSWISSPKLTFLEFGLGDTSCWSICLLSAMVFFVGVELFRFFLGEGVPRKVEKYYFW